MDAKEGVLNLNTDELWCWEHAPVGRTLDPYQLFLEAQAHSTYEQLGAVFAVSVEALTDYKPIIERARLIAQHEFLKKLKQRVEENDRDAIRIYAEMLKLFEMDKAAPLTAEEQLTPEKVREVFKRG